MRATDLSTLSKPLVLANPQDGTSSPATFIDNTSSREAASTLTVLVRPVNNDKLSTVVSLEFVVPVVKVENEVNKVIALERWTLTRRIDKSQSPTEISAGTAAFAEIISDTQIVAALNGSRLA